MRREIVVAVLLVAVAGCGADNSRLAQERADALVTAARADDLAPNLTNEIARTLYGDDGGRICGTLKHDKQPTLFGLGRVRALAQPDEHVDRLTAYDRLVVSIYCPEQLDRFDRLLDDLHAGTTVPGA